MFVLVRKIKHRKSISGGFPAIRADQFLSPALVGIECSGGSSADVIRVELIHGLGAYTEEVGRARLQHP